METENEKTKRLLEEEQINDREVNTDTNTIGYPDIE